jgi:REP element-mobilizing transposase RayT
MPSTYLSLHYHIVFSTNQREPMIREAWRSRLHDYLAGTILGLKGHCRAVGGTVDHVHLLVGLAATHTLASFMRELKVASSKWVHEEVKERGFAWQEGYAAFTVSASGVEQVRRYIANQAEHHRTRTFREELKALLDRSGVAYEERYLD